MKKILAMILSLMLITSMLVACDFDQNDVDENNTKPSGETIAKDETIGDSVQDETGSAGNDQSDAFVNADGTINYNFEYFEATNEVYGDGSLIDAFPLLNADDDFWSLTTFAVYPADGVAIEGYEPDEVVDNMTWAEVKDIPMKNLDDVITARSHLPSMNFYLLAEPGDRTVKEMIEDRDWRSFGYLTMQKQFDTFFPKKAGSIAEMIVANYGQPSEVDIYDKTCDVEYYIGNRTVSLSIGENIQQDEDELPYQITVRLRIYEE